MITYGNLCSLVLLYFSWIRSFNYSSQFFISPSTLITSLKYLSKRSLLIRSSPELKGTPFSRSFVNTFLFLRIRPPNPLSLYFTIPLTIGFYMSIDRGIKSGLIPDLLPTAAFFTGLGLGTIFPLFLLKRNKKYTLWLSIFWVKTTFTVWWEILFQR